MFCSISAIYRLAGTGAGLLECRIIETVLHLNKNTLTYSFGHFYPMWYLASPTQLFFCFLSSASVPINPHPSHIQLWSLHRFLSLPLVLLPTGSPIHISLRIQGKQKNNCLTKNIFFYRFILWEILNILITERQRVCLFSFVPSSHDMASTS